MAINLQKGQRENINAPKFTVGLGWDTNNSSTGTAFDLDASLSPPTFSPQFNYVP